MKKKRLLAFIATGLGSVFMAGTAFASVDLKLNPDVLRIEKDDYYHESQEPFDESYQYHDNLRYARDIFIGTGNERFTFADVKRCLDKYGVSYIYDGNEGSDGLRIKDLDLYIGASMDDERSPYWEAQDAIFEEYDTYSLANVEMNRRINEAMDSLLVVDGNSGFEIYFTDVYNEVTNEFQRANIAQIEAFIERVEIMNGNRQAEGWKFEDGAWRYYVNGNRITGWKEIDGKWYYFKEDTSMAHTCLLTIDGSVYGFSVDGPMEYGWQIKNPGDGDHWYYFGSDGAALTGWQSSIDGDNFKYFFWTDGYTDQNGAAHNKGTEAMGSNEEYTGVFQNGTLLYLVDKDGHLLVNTEVNYRGNNYIVDNEGNVKPSKCLLDQKLDELRIKFASGRYWNHNVGQPNNPDLTTDKACTHHSNCDYYGNCGCNSFGNGIQCQGFAQKITNDIYGVSFFADNSQWTRSYSYSDDIGKGDVVQIDGGYGDVHYYVITNEDSANYYVVDNNWTGKCQISWDRAVQKSFIKDRFRSWWRFNNLAQYLQ